MTPTLSRIKTGRLRHWLVLVPLAALMPKCLLCLSIYLGIGAGLGLRFRSQELCSASTHVWSFAEIAAVGLFFASAFWISRHALDLFSKPRD